MFDTGILPLLSADDRARLFYLADQDRDRALAPTDDYVNARKDSLDKGLREAIDEAVSLIARRIGNER